MGPVLEPGLVEQLRPAPMRSICFPTTNYQKPVNSWRKKSDNWSTSGVPNTHWRSCRRWEQTLEDQCSGYQLSSFFSNKAII